MHSSVHAARVSGTTVLLFPLCSMGCQPTRALNHQSNHLSLYIYICPCLIYCLSFACPYNYGPYEPVFWLKSSSKAMTQFRGRAYGYYMTYHAINIIIISLSQHNYRATSTLTQLLNYRTRLAQRTSFNTLDNWGHKIPTQSKNRKERKG